MAGSSSICITYIPSDCGSIIPGKSKAPKAFQDAGIVDKLKQVGVTHVSESNALESPVRYSTANFTAGSVRNEELNVEVCQKVFRTVLNNLEADQANSTFQLIVGGECCTLPAVMSAFWHHATRTSSSKRVGLLYIDADTDLASPTDPGSSGNLSGMNMTHLVQTPGSLQSMKQFSQKNGKPVCDASNMVLFGTNMSFSGNTPDHFRYLFDNGYKVVSSASIVKQPEQRAEQALSHLLDCAVDEIFVHLDVDSIDPRMFPLANLPNFTGVTFNTMMRALKIILLNPKVKGLKIAEVNPDHDPGLGLIEQLTDELVAILAAR